MGDVAYIRKEDKKVNNQYTFVSHDQVSKILHPALVEHGITVIPRVTSWEQDGNRTTANVDVQFTNVDEPEDHIIVPAFGFGIDPQDKGPGKAISYACKYAMLKTFVLETGDDPERDSIDHANYTAEEKAKYDDLLSRSDPLAFYLFRRTLGDETWSGLYNSFPQGQKTKKKAVADELEAQGNDVYQNNWLATMITYIREDDESSLKEFVADLEIPLKTVLWLDLSADEKTVAKKLLAA
jgi:hypothetical protein